MVHSRSRGKQYSQLFGHTHTQDTHQLENLRLQKTHIHRHHHPVHIQSPLTTQIRGYQIFIQRLNSYELHDEEYQQEENIIHILYNNFFPINTKKHPYHTPRQLQTSQPPKHERTTFTYAGKETRYITNLFTHTDLRTAFRTDNTIHNLLMHRNQIPEKFSLSGVYKLTCPDCKKAYVGQTGRSFTMLQRTQARILKKQPHFQICAASQ